MYRLFITRPNRYYCYVRTMIGEQREISECAECGRKFYSSVKMTDDAFLLIEGGKKVPDFLDKSQGGLDLYVSSIVIDLFEANNISGYRVEKEIPLFREVKKDKFQKVDDVRYYGLTITGKIDFDLKAMHLKKKHVCNSCGRFDWSIQRLSAIDTKLDMSTWDQSDICSVSSSPGHIVCSDKVKNLIDQKKLTGVHIQEEKDMFRLRYIGEK